MLPRHLDTLVCQYADPYPIIRGYEALDRVQWIILEFADENPFECEDVVRDCIGMTVFGPNPFAERPFTVDILDDIFLLRQAGMEGKVGLTMRNKIIYMQFFSGLAYPRWPPIFCCGH